MKRRTVRAVVLFAHIFISLLAWHVKHRHPPSSGGLSH
ncbi:hypothetical protein GGD40_007377 [Paraburkholderia bryophila]|uniref:Uncharacterized protein n=1 Tax=Paraburkholderia bryophila TaxID=420952 RepID=A0A7Y9WVJ5_9BURK|nr:hypothetical protein [Paraburkholderia bryophila]